MGVAILPIDILESDASAYDKHIMTILSVCEGESAEEIAQWQNLDVSEVRSAMTRWMEKGAIERHEGTWRVTPGSFEISDDNL